MDRRQFLKITFAAGVAAACPVAFSDIGALPLIVGDGEHDDMAGIQAAIDGKPFVAVDDCVTVKNGTVTFSDNLHMITTTINIPKGATVVGPRVCRGESFSDDHAMIRLGESVTIGDAFPGQKISIQTAPGNRATLRIGK